MKIEVIRPIPEPVTVKIEIPLSIAQMIVVSMGRNHTGEMPKDMSEAHYKFFDQLDKAVGRGTYRCEVRDNYEVRGRGEIWLLAK